jgi:hypothetical protein
MCWPLRGGRGTYTQKPIKIYRNKKRFPHLTPVYRIQSETTRARAGLLNSKQNFWIWSAGFPDPNRDFLT